MEVLINDAVKEFTPEQLYELIKKDTDYTISLNKKEEEVPQKCIALFRLMNNNHDHEEIYRYTKIKVDNTKDIYIRAALIEKNSTLSDSLDAAYDLQESQECVINTLPYEDNVCSVE